MNKTEQIGYQWLQQQRYAPDQITFQLRKSPDFLTSDGKGWEIKLLRFNAATFTGAQLRALAAHGNTSIVLFDSGHTEPTLVMPFEEMAIPGYAGKYRMICVDGDASGQVLNVRDIDDTAAARIKRAASLRGMTLGEYLARLVDFHDAARAHADAGGDDWQVELETRGLHSVRE